MPRSVASHLAIVAPGKSCKGKMLPVAKRAGHGNKPGAGADDVQRLMPT
jgi:hypothetical protein